MKHSKNKVTLHLTVSSSKIWMSVISINELYVTFFINILFFLQTVEKCLETYGLDNVFLTFNGGKDCTVLLHLINIVRKIRYPEHQKPLFCLYVRDNDTFPEQDKFVAQCQIYYNLDILSLCLGMKEALAELLHRKPNLKACFLGTRRTDPYSGNLATFQVILIVFIPKWFINTERKCIREQIF